MYSQLEKNEGIYCRQWQKVWHCKMDMQPLVGEGENHSQHPFLCGRTLAIKVLKVNVMLEMIQKKIIITHVQSLSISASPLKTWKAHDAKPSSMPSPVVLPRLLCRGLDDLASALLTLVAQRGQRNGRWTFKSNSVP